MLTGVIVEHAGEKAVLETPHELYYRFSAMAFERLQVNEPKIKSLLNKGKELTVHEVNILYENRLSMNNLVVYGALSLEAYINFYAIRYDIPFHNDFEKNLSTLNKWKIYPHLKTNKSLDGSAIKLIKEIFRLRDEIVHPKPNRIIIGDNKPYNGKSIQSKIELLDKGQYIVDLNSVYKAIFKIDLDEKKSYENAPWMLELQRIN
ncbi:hypothetical protein [Vibrio nereis]|uniref:RiboL-PSP-HEPN domain-containing protein n=1 Tax=Vibrio nereis TaxID=693 RepID=A0A0M0HJ26_VIBNE|nr:hypothetical protein [Vibrio nereis]KOO01792.1 hypothetical protein AKJ17_18750 [Vibrio nereis]